MSSYSDQRFATEETVMVLFELAERINAATTYQEIADAVAILMPDCDGVYLLLWENFDCESASEMEIVAGANVPEAQRSLIGKHLSKSWLPVAEFVCHNRITVIENTADPRLYPITEQDWGEFQTRAMICLSFHQGQQNLGGLFFNYTKPRAFSEREKRLALAIRELVLAAFERIRLLHLTQIAHERAEVVASINAALLRATDEASILMAVTEYVEAQGATEMILTYAQPGHSVSNADFKPVARWLFKAESPYELLHEPPGFHQIIMNIRNLAILEPEKIFYVEDIATDERFDPDLRADFVAKMPMRAEAVVGLYSGGSWQGSLVIIWHQPHRFSDHEKYVYSQLLQNLPSVVATRRSYLAEQESRAENELLYSISKAINQATTVDEVMQAVKRCFPDPLYVALIIWEGYDRELASYAEVVLSTNPGTPAGMRWSRDEVADMAALEPGALYVEDDLAKTRGGLGAGRQSQLGAVAFANLTQDQRILGVLSISSPTPHHFTERETRLISALADLTAAALERFHLQVETEQARERAETLAQLSTALSQAVDEDGILAALHPVMQRYGVRLSTLSYSVYDNTEQVIGMQVVAAWTPTTGLMDAEELPGVVQSPQHHPLLKLAVKTPDTPLLVEDIFTDPRPDIQAWREKQHGSRRNAQILIPLHSGKELRGLVTFIWYDAQQFSPELRALVWELQRLLSSVVTTRQAYLAIEQARQETEKRVRELETVAEVSAAAAALREEPQLLRTFVSLMQDNFAPNRVQVYLMMPNQDLRLWQPTTSTETDSTRLSLDEDSPIARAARQRQIILEGERVGLNKQFLDDPPAFAHYATMAVPMIVNRQVVGVLSLHAPDDREFSEADTRVMSTLADLVAVAIQNARYFQQAQELAALEERTRLARELHDSVSQALYGIGLGAQTAYRSLDTSPQIVRKSVEYVLSLAEAGLAEMRALIFELRPESLETEGLVVALTKQGASLQARHGISVNMELCEEPVLPLAAKESLYRVAREALHNVIKHAGASQVIVKMFTDQRDLRLEVIDNGVGFSTDQEFPGHLGLKSMRERVDQLAGSIVIQSTPGQGTHLTVVLPNIHRFETRRKQLNAPTGTDG
jgi:signal transduction histidine kinase